MDRIRSFLPHVELNLITMKTEGDRLADVSLQDFGGRDLFVRELDDALADGRVDICVHSCKDLPLNSPAPVLIAAFTRREDPRDVLVLPEGRTEPDPSLPVGCSSARRALQWPSLYPDIPLAPIRGNIQTRLSKLDDGQYGGLILAAAGLKRLGLERRISRYFFTDEFLPAAGQGALAVTARWGTDTSYLEPVRHEETTRCVVAERAFAAALGADCASPVGAYAEIDSDGLTLTGMDETGRKLSISGDPSESARLGQELADRMRAAAWS
ncbi:MAG: hydroxymethylbilane synthase [Oscillospiraceae bacterium]|nr:hydroxymethylbilane synthase [Oscillospiraceae bacterium]